MERTVDYEKVKAVVNASPIARDALMLLYSRPRGRQDTSVHRLCRLLRREGKKFTAKEIEALLIGLQAAGAGRIVFNKNKPARLVWTYNLRSVAAFALGLPQPQSKAKNAPKVPNSTIQKQPAQRVRLPALAPTEAPGVQPQTVAPPLVERRQHQVHSDPVTRTMIIRRNGIEFVVPLDATPAEADAVNKIMLHAASRSS